MIVLKYRMGRSQKKLMSKDKSQYGALQKFLVSMVEKYGKAVLEEIETEEQVIKSSRTPVIEL